MCFSFIAFDIFSSTSNIVCFRYLNKILLECELALDLGLGLKTQLPFEYEPENILISGATGSGKTTICKILVEKLQNPPYFVHTHMMDCRSLKGRSIDL